MNKIMLFAGLLILTSCGFVNHSKYPLVDGAIHNFDAVYIEDNFVEELVEDGIEATTSLSVDLSPKTPEIKTEEGK